MARRNEIEIKAADGTILKGDKHYIWVFPYLGQYEKAEDMRIKDIPKIILDKIGADGEAGADFAAQMALLLLTYSYGKFYDTNEAKIPEDIFFEFMHTLKIFVSFNALLDKGYILSWQEDAFGEFIKSALHAVDEGLKEIPFRHEKITVVLNPDAVEHHKSMTTH